MASRASAPVLRSLPAPGTYLCGLTWDGERLWHSDQQAGQLFAIDPTTGAVLTTVDCPRARADLAFHDGLLCQVGGKPKRLLLVDARTGRAVGEKEVAPPSGRLCGVEMSPEGMWMGLRSPAILQLRDFATMAVLREFPVLGHPSGLTYVDGVVLYTEFENCQVRAYDAVTGAPRGVVPLAGRPVGMTWDGSHVWYCDFAARRFNAVSLADLLPRRV
jgi:hypothetical protein